MSFTDPDQLHRALRTVVRVQEHRDRARAAGFGISAAGADALESLAHLGPVSLNRLAAELYIDKSTASRVVALLEERGWVMRLADPEDGRGIRLQLTEAGAGLQSEIHADAAWETHAVWRALSDGQRDALGTLLEEWARIAAAQAGLSPPEPVPEAT